MESDIAIVREKRQVPACVDTRDDCWKFISSSDTVPKAQICLQVPDVLASCCDFCSKALATGAIPEGKHRRDLGGSPLAKLLNYR